jgi:hypothetical protein
MNNPMPNQVTFRNTGPSRVLPARLRGGVRDSTSMDDVARLTAVASQGEADVICSLLRAYGIRCSERAASESGEPAAVGGWREILVGTDDLDAAREVMAAKQGD